MDILQAKKAIVEICHRMHQRNYISASDGNLSIKISNKKIVTTPSGVNKGFIKENDLITVDMTGAKTQGKGKPSSEIKMHLCIYEVREDVNAIIHAHPPYCIALSLAGISLAQCLLPESIFALGTIPTLTYATPTTEDVPLIIEQPIQKHNGVILDRHGTVTVAENIYKAYDRLESMEQVAHITAEARKFGNIEPLSQKEVNKLIGITQMMGTKRQTNKCLKCKGCGRV